MSEKKPQGQDGTLDQNQPTPPVDNAPLQPAIDQAQAPVQDKDKPRLDVTIPGGKYLNAAGQLVNANNEPIDETGRVLKLQ